MRVSAIIPVGIRPYNIPEIAKSLPFDEIIYIKSDDKIWGRYQAMRHAKYPIIYTQDDDIVNLSLDKLQSSFTEDPYSVHYSIPEDYLSKIEAKTFGKCQLALVGWGTMFHRDLLKAFDKYTDKYGVDELLLREADRAFTVLQGHHHIPVIAELKHLSGETDEHAMSSECTHVQTMSEMVVKCIQLCE